VVARNADDFGGVKRDSAGALGRQRRDRLKVGLSIQQRGKSTNKLEIVVILFDPLDRLVERSPPFANVALIGADELRGQRAAPAADKLGAVPAAAAGHSEEILCQHAVALTARR